MQDASLEESSEEQPRPKINWREIIANKKYYDAAKFEGIKLSFWEMWSICTY